MLWKLEVVSKVSKGAGKGKTVSGRRTEGKERVEKGVFFFILPPPPPSKNPSPQKNR